MVCVQFCGVLIYNYDENANKTISNLAIVALEL